MTEPHRKSPEDIRSQLEKAVMGGDFEALAHLFRDTAEEDMEAANALMAKAQADGKRIDLQKDEFYAKLEYETDPAKKRALVASYEDILMTSIQDSLGKINPENLTPDIKSALKDLGLEF